MYFSRLQLYSQITPLELLALIIAALCHDLDHPGECACVLHVHVYMSHAYSCTYGTIHDTYMTHTCRLVLSSIVLECHPVSVV